MGCFYFNRRVLTFEIYDRWSDDELQVCVTVRNDGNLATEWDLVLLIDTLPDRIREILPAAG